MLPPASPTLSKRSGSSSMPGTNAASRSSGPRHQNRPSPSHALNHFANATLEIASRLSKLRSNHSQVAAIDRNVGVVGAERRLTDRHRLLQLRLGALQVPKRPQHHAEV